MVDVLVGDDHSIDFLVLLLFPVLTFAQNAPADIVYNSRRAVALEGGSNFRDLGGYPAAMGKTVKWGHIYRSADVSKLTNADLKTLEARHIATVCDLRGPSELKTNPDRLPTGVTYVNLPAGSETTQANANYVAMNRDSLMDGCLHPHRPPQGQIQADVRPVAGSGRYEGADFPLHGG